MRTRVVMDVTLDLPGLDEPGTGRLVADPGATGADAQRPHLRRGRWIRPGHPDEVLVSEAFGRANGLQPGDSIPAVINGRWQRLRIVGIALSPEYVYEIRGLGDIFPDNRRFGVLWMGERALGAAFQMEGAFNDVSIALAPGASEADVIDATDRLLAPYGGTGAYGRADHLSNMFVSSEIEETQITSVLLPAIFLGVTAFLLNMVLARLVATQRDQIAVLKAFGYGNAAVAFHYLQLALGPVIVGAVERDRPRDLAGGGARPRLCAVLPVPDRDLCPGLECGRRGVSRGRRRRTPRRGRRGPPRRAAAARPRRCGPRRRRFTAPGLSSGWACSGWCRQPSGSSCATSNGGRSGHSLAVTGIALATAIVMTGWFMFDAIDVMKQIQFEAVQRYDVMVVFDTPRVTRAVVGTRPDRGRAEGGAVPGGAGAAPASASCQARRHPRARARERVAAAGGPGPGGARGAARRTAALRRARGREARRGGR